MNTNRRVVYAPEHLAHAFPATAFTEIGRIDRDTIWASIDDTTMVSAPYLSALPILYFSVADYVHAVRDLTPEQVVEVVQFRRKNFAPRALSEDLFELYRAQRVCFSLASQSAQHNPQHANAYQAHLVESLRYLANLNGARFEQIESLAVMDQACYGQSEVRDEAHRTVLIARKHASASVVAGLEAEEKVAESHQDVLGRALAELHGVTFDGLHPMVGRARGTFVRPRTDALIEYLEAMQSAGIAWRDGILASFDIPQIERMRANGSSCTVMYLDPRVLMREVSELTAPQFERELQARLAGSGTTVPARVSHLNGMRLEQLLLWHGALESVRRKAPPAFAIAQTRAKTANARAVRDGKPAVQTAVAEAESEWLVAANTLRDSLAHNATWLDAIDPKENPATELLAAERTMIRDAQFFAAMHRTHGDPSVANDFDQVANEKRRMLTDLESAVGARP